MKKQIITGVICGGIGLLGGFKLLERVIIKELKSDNFKREMDKQFNERFGKSHRGVYRSYYKGNSKREVDNLIFETRTDAMEAIDKLEELIKLYGCISRADMYDIAGGHCNFTDNAYGWTDISTAEIKMNEKGYLLKMPRATKLK